MLPPAGEAASSGWSSISVLNSVIIHPRKTTGQPVTIVPPWAQVSPIRAAGLLHIKTFVLPMMTESTGPVHNARVPIVAAGNPPIRTKGKAGDKRGPPT